MIGKLDREIVVSKESDRKTVVSKELDREIVVSNGLGMRMLRMSEEVFYLYSRKDRMFASNCDVYLTPIPSMTSSHVGVGCLWCDSGRFALAFASAALTLCGGMIPVSASQYRYLPTKTSTVG